MPLQPEPRVPHVVTGAIDGVDGGSVIVIRHDGEADTEIHVCHADRERMAWTRLSPELVAQLVGLLK